MSGLYDQEGVAYNSVGSSYNSLTADGTYTEQPGRFAMSPNPFDAVRSLETYDRLTLKLPGGHTRYVACDVGGLTTIPVIGLYKADLTFTDTPAPSVVPEGWVV